MKEFGPMVLDNSEGHISNTTSTLLQKVWRVNALMLCLKTLIDQKRNVGRSCEMREKMSLVECSVFTK